MLSLKDQYKRKTLSRVCLDERDGEWEREMEEWRKQDSSHSLSRLRARRLTLLCLYLSLSRSNSSSDSIRKEALAYKTLETQKWLFTVKMVNAQCGYDVNTQNILWQRFTNYILNTSFLSFVHLHDPPLILNRKLMLSLGSNLEPM